MWDVVKKTGEHVVQYSTVCGRAYYLIVFLFRLIVVDTIGSSVYGDEQSAFKCSTKVIGCENVCYDRFAKISHMRFWAFQILAVATPVILFHFYALIVEGRIEKLRDLPDEKNSSTLESSESKWNVVRDQHVHDTIRRRQRKVGKTKEKKRYLKDQLMTVRFTRSIRIGYFLSVLARMTIEIIFVYLAFDMFRFAKYPNVAESVVISDGRRVNSPFDLFWIQVPQLYRCTGETVRSACFQHMLPGNSDAYVPCWVSRPWEKTIFLRYMNTLSVVCILLCVVECIQLTVQFCKTYKKKLKKRSDPFNYKKAPSSNNFMELSPSIKPIPAATDAAYSNRDETDIEKAPTTVAMPEKASPPPTLSPSDKKPTSNVFVDLATGKINVNELREALQNPKTESKRKPSKSSGSPNKLPNILKKNAVTAITESDGPKPDKRRTKFQYIIPSGTQSLNRPRKLAKGRYSTLFRLDSASFSSSGVDNDDDDEGSDSESSDGGDDYSASNHSSLEIDKVV